MLAAVATAAATFGITFYAMSTKSDFTSWMSSFYGNSFLI
jgi:FtsH-binding integral membrane protein